MILKLQSKHNLIECGTDEAGRGCLAGPVTAAAVILPKNFKNLILTDSKLLTHKSRESLRLIIEEQAVAYAIAHIFPTEIDEINILNASIKAMHLAIENLKTTPEHILVDGNRFKPLATISHECIIKGDSKFLPIAAASILAKTERDRYMTALHMKFPQYNWNKNKGYPTKEHREAIRAYGLTPHHRKSFKQLPDQLSLDI
ncbi:RNase HII [Leeuwenhoekiella aestuarii]|uniref:Ribonuclease HII n=1 Tax=Leeuwenhoekiella aestuarii TaxID=2249426 RepID=A0A4Q0NNW1_9FLAO|nr:ribonuclease HII [Leeuwenhoekiella aestuarii]RXG11346.1 RNase HII [Leeuwenhoekiella aestuarii]RXG11769.1 RNase HII [Leeuwenhoekiella aestuarii]